MRPTSTETFIPRAVRPAPHDAKELHDGAWITFDEAFLGAADADSLMAQLTAASDWIQRPIVVFGKEIMQPRLLDWGSEVPYKYSGQTLEPKPLTPALAALTEQVAERAGAPFNHVLLNLYRDGKDSIAPHADNEPELGRYPIIGSLSLGAERSFVMNHKRQRKRRSRIRLTHGSLVVMGGTMQRTWRHAVPKEPAVTGPRINVTFRWLCGPPGWRDPEWVKRSGKG